VQCFKEMRFIIYTTISEIVFILNYLKCVFFMKILVIYVRYWWKINFLKRISKSPQISNFTKILTVGTELLDAEERTDGRTESGLIRRGKFSANASKFVMWCFGKDHEIYSSCIDYDSIELNILYLHITTSFN